MSNSPFERQVLDELKDLKKDISTLKEQFEDHVLTEEDKSDIAEAVKEEKKGKLSSKEEVF